MTLKSELHLKVLGILALSVVVVVWVGSSVIQQKVFLDLHYAKPYFFNYFCSMLFSFYLASFCFRPSNKEFYRLLVDAIQLGPIWFATNLCLTYSLVQTRIGSNAVLGSLTGVFVLIMSIMFLKHSPDLLKFVAAGLAIGDVVLIAAQDSQEPQGDAYYGDLTALIGAAFYAFYTILLKHKQITEDIPHLFGLIGVVNSVIFLPGLILFDYTEVESFVVPDISVFGYFLLGAITSSFILDILLAVSIRFLNPVLCQLSLTLTIPLSFLYEFLQEDKEFAPMYLLGTLLVLAGFTLMTLFENDKLASKLSNASLWRFLNNSSDARALI